MEQPGKGSSVTPSCLFPPNPIRALAQPLDSCPQPRDYWPFLSISQVDHNPTPSGEGAPFLSALLLACSLPFPPSPHQLSPHSHLLSLSLLLCPSPPPPTPLKTPNPTPPTPQPPTLTPTLLTQCSLPPASPSQVSGVRSTGASLGCSYLKAAAPGL